MNMHPRDLALIILCCVIWGFAFIAAKAGADEFPPLLFTALRYGLLALMMFSFCALASRADGFACRDRLDDRRALHFVLL